MIAVKPQTFSVPVQASGTNVFINLPKPLRDLYGIQGGDTLILVTDPAGEIKLYVADIVHAATEEGETI